MDWNAAIERNRETLKRLVALLMAMAGLTSGAALTSPLWGGRRSSDRRVGVIVGVQPPPDASRRPPHKGEVGSELRPTLPRHLHRAVLRLLRPAEAAARRLVIVAARKVVLPPPAPPRPRKPKRKSAILRNGVGTGIVLPGNFPPQAGLDPTAVRKLALPLIDPLPRLRRRRPAASSIPRISFAGFGAPFPVPVRRPPSPSDPIDATRLALRLSALASALDDLPTHARRFARWRSRLHRGLVRRISPLRPGRPPGGRPANSRRPAHEVHDVLNDLQWFAFEAFQRPDTS